MKKCTKCGQIKPLSEFNKNNSVKDGHQSWCRSCQNNKSFRIARKISGICKVGGPKNDLLCRVFESLPETVSFNTLMNAQRECGFKRNSLCGLTINKFVKTGFNTYEKRVKLKPLPLNYHPATLQDYTNQQLFDELKRRGIKAKIQVIKIEEVEI